MPFVVTTNPDLEIEKPGPLSICTNLVAGQPTMTAQKLVMAITILTGGAVGLLAPIGFVKWLLRTEPEDAGILTLFFFPVWCLLVVLGLLIGRRLGLRITGGRRVAQR